MILLTVACIVPFLQSNAVNATSDTSDMSAKDDSEQDCPPTNEKKGTCI